MKLKLLLVFTVFFISLIFSNSTAFSQEKKDLKKKRRGLDSLKVRQRPVRVPRKAEKDKNKAVVDSSGKAVVQTADSSKIKGKELIKQLEEEFDSDSTKTEEEIPEVYIFRDTVFIKLDSVQNNVLNSRMHPDSVYNKIRVKRTSDLFSPGLSVTGIPVMQQGYPEYAAAGIFNNRFISLNINGIPFETPLWGTPSLSVIPWSMIKYLDFSSFTSAYEPFSNRSATGIVIKTKEIPADKPVSEIIYSLGGEDTSHVEILFGRRLGRKMGVLFAGNIQRVRRDPRTYDADGHNIWGDLTYDLSSKYELFSNMLISRKKSGYHSGLSHINPYQEFNNYQSEKYETYILGARNKSETSRLYLKYMFADRRLNIPGMAAAPEVYQELFGLGLNKTWYLKNIRINTNLKYDNFHVRGDSLQKLQGSLGEAGVQSIWKFSGSMYNESYINLRKDSEIDKIAGSAGSAVVYRKNNSFLAKFYVKRTAGISVFQDTRLLLSTFRQNENLSAENIYSTGLLLGTENFYGIKFSGSININSVKNHIKYILYDNEYISPVHIGKTTYLSGNFSGLRRFFGFAEISADLSVNNYKVNLPNQGKIVFSFIDPEDRWIKWPLNSRFNFVLTYLGEKNAAGYDPVSRNIYPLAWKQPSALFFSSNMVIKIGSFNLYYEWVNILNKNYSYITGFPMESSRRNWGIRWMFFD